MKKLLLVILVTVMAVPVFGQLDTINTGTSANSGTGENLRSAMSKTNDLILAWNNALMYNLSAAELAVLNNVPATLTGTELGYVDGVTSAIQTQLNSKQATLISGTNIKTINSTDLLGSGDMVIGTGGTMDYPGSGLAKSTGTSWTTPVTDNSANWNTAYSWGNWATAVGLKVSISDTASMLVPYINRADTASMLTRYAKDVDVALKVSIADTATMLTKYARKASPTFMGTVTIPTPFTLGAVSVTANGTELNVLDNIPGTLTSTELGYLDGVTSAIQTQLNAKVSTSEFISASGSLTLSGADAVTLTTTAATSVTLPTSGTLATTTDLSDYLLAADTASLDARITDLEAEMADTVNIETLLDIELSTDTVADLSELRALETSLLAIIYDTVAFETEELSDLVQVNAATRSVMGFGAGGFNAGDTTSFTTSSIYQSFYWGGSLSFHVDSMIVSMGHGLGLDTLGVQISWSDTLNAVVPTKLNTAALPIGRVAGVNKALTVGQVDAAFDNAVIPPGKIVKCTTPYVPAAALKRKPTYLSVTLIGHLQ